MKVLELFTLDGCSTYLKVGYKANLVIFVSTRHETVLTVEEAEQLIKALQNAVATVAENSVKLLTGDTATTKEKSHSNES